MAEPKKLDPIDFDKPQSSEDSESTKSKDNSGHAPSGPRPSGPRPSGGGLSAKFDALLGEEPEEDVSSEGESELDTDSFEGDIEEAEDMQQIGESTTIQSNDSVSLPKISEEIKVILNSDESTKGINRISIKDSEIWIHYDDSINLNNIMVPVIEKLNASGYQYLEFNRLARSENAIVFQVDNKNTTVSHEEDIDEY